MEQMRKREKEGKTCVKEANLIIVCSVSILQPSCLPVASLYEPTRTADFAETTLLHKAVAKFLNDSTFLSFSKMRCQDRYLLHNEIL